MSSELGSNIELIDKATPFTLILALYGADVAINSCQWQQMKLIDQCQLLQPNKINSKSSRKAIIDRLSSDKNNFENVNKSYIRIRIKWILSQFYKESVKLKSKTNIKEWNGHQLLISFIGHILAMSEDDNVSSQKAASHPKVWEFIEYMRRYFRDTNYNGKTFLSVFDDEKVAKGFGLMMMRTICTKYSLKSGPFSKVKKHCNAWAIKLRQQSQQNQNKYQSIVKQMVNDQKQNNYNHNNNNNNDNNQNHNGDNNHNKPTPSIVPKNNNNKNDSNNTGTTYVTKDNCNDILNGRSWYWLCDYNGLKWVPYRSQDVELLNKAWRNKDKCVKIKNGSYRVELNYTNESTPCGNQFNNTIANPNSRVVKCEPPQQTIFGMAVQKNPM